MDHGTATVDWGQRGGFLVTFPDGKMETANSRAHVFAIVKRWSQQQTDLVGRVMGNTVIGSTRVNWLNGTNK